MGDKIQRTNGACESCTDFWSIVQSLAFSLRDKGLSVRV